jgi:hypothetical protein
MENIMHSFASFSRRAFALLALVTATAVFAGPPLICHPYDIAHAKSLPGGNEWHGVNLNYDRTHLVADTMALITPETPVLVRMETLRRAAVYATEGMKYWGKGSYPKEDRDLAYGVMDKLRERAAAAKPEARALAIFDVGFFAETLRQTGLDPNLDGHALIAEAARLRPQDAEIAFALALASTSPQRAQEQSEQLARARAGAKPGSLLALNLASHFSRS